MVSKKIMAVMGGLAALGSLGIAGAAQAGVFGDKESVNTERSETQEGAHEAQLLSSARIPLADAVRTAEQHTGLKASEAGLDDEVAVATWEVSVGSGAQEKTVLVDAQSGHVKSVAADDGESESGADSD
ncbi:MAG: PepSY domain-containing protein [Novosphingobium sp.]